MQRKCYSAESINTSSITGKRTLREWEARSVLKEGGALAKSTLGHGILRVGVVEGVTWPDVFQQPSEQRM